MGAWLSFFFFFFGVGRSFLSVAQIFIGVGHFVFFSVGQVFIGWFKFFFF